MAWQVQVLSTGYCYVCTLLICEVAQFSVDFRETEHLITKHSDCGFQLLWGISPLSIAGISEHQGDY